MSESAASGLTPKPSAEAPISSVTGPSEPAGATGQFCRNCGTAMEAGSAVCGDCGTHTFRTDPVKISISKFIDEAMAIKFCTQCGTRVTEGERLCHKCDRPVGKLNLETPGANTAPAPRLTPCEAKESQMELNSRGYDDFKPAASSGRRSTTTLTPADMMSIQYAIDRYEQKFPQQPSPSAEVALTWLASQRGHRGWRRFNAFFGDDRSVATAAKQQLIAEETCRPALWRQPMRLAGGTIVVVVAAVVINSFYINNRPGASVARVTGGGAQRTSVPARTVAKEKPPAAVQKKFSSQGSAVNQSLSRVNDAPSVEASPTISDHHRAGVPAVAVTNSDSHTDIRNMLENWAKAINNNDVTLQMRYYSERLDRYFLARNVTQKFVLQDKARFYRQGNHIVAYQIRNVTVDKQSAQQAAVSLIKRWEIVDGVRTKSGQTRSRLWLTRRGNRWIITGEQDLTDLQPAPRRPGSAHKL